MKGADRDRKESGFRVRTRVDDAQSTLETALEARNVRCDQERVALERADGRVLGESITADVDVPHYERAAMDGYALQAADTFGASERSPAVLRLEDRPDPESALPPETARRVHTGSAIPDNADAVVMLEHAESLATTGELEVLDAVAEGENVAPVGEDVEAGQRLYESGHRLRPSDLGLLRSAGNDRPLVSSRPSVGVVPTGEEVVQDDPDPGEVIETNGLTVSRLVERWGGRATHREVVTDDAEALRVAIQRDLTKDVVVTTGGSSVGQRDLLPEVIDDLGEVLVHGVALKPGHPVCLGIVEETPVLALPGYPVACLINAVQFLRPTLAWVQGTEATPHPTVTARLGRKIASEPGTRTFARVSLEADEGVEEADEEGEDGSEGGNLVATPTRASGSGVLSSVALADGWVVVPEDREGIPADETVAVENWEPWF
ncbi:molybdopterin molybdotransferase MoeA [Natronosalvus halobius]|uniref:molybdopterin molybdotransferase MoeA n=1 Tax=Natronosalvus halobius TaxID=2953746 RepID=UPI00209E57FD|nr:molybdopterin molybdotransferase MoeA [Natronosalvus halobius]USZ73034.1 molybdopterin molybdotransferase MoeA [Natronosalvus halobius]